MARTGTTFLSLFDEFTRAVISTPGADVSGTQRTNLIQQLNAAYRSAWNYEGTEWEDSWEEGDVAVTDGVIAYADIDDAHVFLFYSADPREDTSAQYIEASTAKAGIFVGSTWNDGVFGFWRPVCPEWDGSDTDDTIITALKDATLAFAEAAYYRTSGQHATAGARRKDAQVMCEELAAIEFPRVQSKWWLRRRER